MQLNDIHDDDDAMAEINIVPLVDIMLVLLIIFMVTAPLSISGVQVALPTGQNKALKVNNNRLILTINNKGDYYIEKLKINKETLTDKLRNIYIGREDKDLYIRADKNVTYRYVMSAMSSAKEAGASRISMLSKSKG